VRLQRQGSCGFDFWLRDVIAIKHLLDSNDLPAVVLLE
jgi:hypothetical protein